MMNRSEIKPVLRKKRTSEVWLWGCVTDGLRSPIKLPHFKIKWNAKGAILDGAQIFGMAGNSLLGGGEAGREAVLPLDRNTGWMDSLAEKVAQRVTSGGAGGTQSVTVYVTLDGKVVGKSVVNYAIGEAKSTGQLPWAAYT